MLQLLSKLTTDCQLCSQADTSNWRSGENRFLCDIASGLDFIEENRTRTLLCHKYVTRVLQECHKSVTRVLQDHFREAEQAEQQVEKFFNNNQKRKYKLQEADESIFLCLMSSRC